MTTCQRTIIHKDWTGHRKLKCGRLATQKQDDGLPLCERHYNRWRKKDEGMTMTDAQLHTLRHMLGINTPNDRVPKPYRNYAATVPGDPEYLALENRGAVEKYYNGFAFEFPFPTDYVYYRCTDAGKLAAMRSHREIRKTKSKRVYARFLDISDSFAELTFKQFLTDPQFADTRRDA